MNQEEIQQQLEMQKQVDQMEIIVKRHLTKEALQRFGNIKAAHPEKALQVLVVLVEYLQKNPQQIDDEKLKSLLQSLAEKKEFNIQRK